MNEFTNNNLLDFENSSLYEDQLEIQIGNSPCATAKEASFTQGTQKTKGRTEDMKKSELHNEQHFNELEEEIKQNTTAIFANEASYDVESLAERLNDVSNYLRKEVMSQYFDVKGKLHKKIQDQLRKIIQEKELIILEKEKKIENLEEGMKKRDTSLKRYKGLMFRMADTIAHVRNQERLGSILHKCFIKWREYVHEKKRKATMNIMARRYYIKRIKRHILQGWYIWIIQTKRCSLDSIWQLRMDSTIAEVTNDYEMKLEQMRKQIEALNARLVHETKDKKVLQENLKKALMRGVCAMNNQFLDIIKGTTDTGTFLQNMTETELEEVMIQQLFENDSQPNNTPSRQEENTPAPREQMSLATTSHIQQYVREYQPPSVQPYFPTQQSQSTTRQSSQYSSTMDAGEIRSSSQQRVRVTKVFASRTASPPKTTTAASIKKSTTNTADQEKRWKKY